MPFTTETRAAVRLYLLGEARRYVTENIDRAETKAKPFHAALMPIPFLAWSGLSERSFSTRTGTWFKRVALIVARQYHQEAAQERLVQGQLQPAAEAHITTLIEQMDHGEPKRRPNRVRDIAEVLAVQSPGGAARSHISDLYVLTNDGRELYFEMKTPEPNKDTSKAMKEGILKITALRVGHQAEAYGSCAYNPYGDGQPYVWNYAVQFLEPGTDLLVGRQFWEKIGDADTYDELLAVAKSVGAELMPLIEGGATGLAR